MEKSSNLFDKKSSKTFNASKYAYNNYVRANERGWTEEIHYKLQNSNSIFSEYIAYYNTNLLDNSTSRPFLGNFNGNISGVRYNTLKNWTIVLIEKLLN